MPLCCCVRCCCVAVLRFACVEVLGEFYGEAEGRLAAVFDEAAANTPAIIFLDEVDAIASTGGSGTVKHRGLHWSSCLSVVWSFCCFSLLMCSGHRVGIERSECIMFH